MQQIIIVEDDQIIREELQIFLSKYGYEIKAPTEFNNIVDYILKQNADLVLLDINLPVFDGYFICREIRKTSEVPTTLEKLPIIVPIMARVGALSLRTNAENT